MTEDHPARPPAHIIVESGTGDWLDRELDPYVSRPDGEVRRADPSTAWSVGRRLRQPLWRAWVIATRAYHGRWTANGVLWTALLVTATATGGWLGATAMTTLATETAPSWGPAYAATLGGALGAWVCARWAMPDGLRWGSRVEHRLRGGTRTTWLTAMRQRHGPYFGMNREERHNAIMAHGRRELAELRQKNAEQARRQRNADAVLHAFTRAGGQLPTEAREATAEGGNAPPARADS